MQRVLRKSSPASNNQIPQASLPSRAGALFSCRLSSFWQSAGLQNHRPLVRIHPHENSILLQTENRQRISTLTVFYGRGWITQAALLKIAHRAVFSPSSATGPQLFESTRLASGKVITKQKLQYPVRILEFLVGAGGFEPPKLKSSRFTVCPHWPLGNTPISYFQSSLTACIFYHLKWHLSTTFSTDFLFFCRSLFSCVLPQ